MVQRGITPISREMKALFPRSGDEAPLAAGCKNGLSPFYWRGIIGCSRDSSKASQARANSFEGSQDGSRVPAEGTLSFYTS